MTTEENEAAYQRLVKRAIEEKKGGFWYTLKKTLRALLYPILK